MVSHKNRIRVSAIRAVYVLLIITGFHPGICTGQEDTSKVKKNYMNAVKFNLTNPMIFSPKYNVLGYERVINKHQTFSVGIGRFALGDLVSGADSIRLLAQKNDKGFNFSVDYRFYLKKENRYSAPRGVYIGPYYSFNYFSRDLEWDINTSSMNGQVSTGFDLMANLVGAQLGYQFIFWDRVSLDMILFGPGLWFFNLESNFETNLDPEDQEMILDQLNQMLRDRFPGSDYVFTGGGIEAKKVTSTSTMGIRYLITIGFRF